MAKFIKKRFPALFVVTYFIVALSMVGFLIYPALFIKASLQVDFTNTGAPTATWGPSYADQLVLDVTIPDAWNGGAYTADILYYDAGNVDNWQGETLNAFAALGTTSGVGYVEDLVDPGFQTTEGVVADLDADSVVTTAADELIDGDGSGSIGIGTVDPAAAGGDPLLAMGDNAGHGGLAICADSLFPWVLTALRIDTNGDCTDGTQTEGTYLVGTNATAAATESNGTWAFGDAVTMGGNADGDYDDGEDIFYENNVGELTYSAGADGTYVVGSVGGSVISDFPADCDGAGAGSEACKYTGAGAFDGNSNIYIDDGTAGGAAPNSVVDRQDDQFIGIGVQNTGTAVDVTDIEFVDLWADAGAAGFQGSGTDTYCGKLSVNSLNDKEWSGNCVPQAVSGTLRIFVTVDLTATPTDGATLKFRIPIYNDAGGDGGAGADGDLGVFMSSTNDGPTDVAILNANTQTIDSAGPTITSRVTTDNDNDGKIDRITFTTNENLDDDFTGLTITVDGYIVESYDTGGSANDNIFLVIFTEGGTFDTGVTPDTQITINSSLGDAYANDIAVDGAPVAPTDGAIPTVGTITYKDADGDGKIDRIMLTYTETVTGDSVVSANDLVFDNVGSFTGAAFGVNASDLVTGAVSFTNINLGTEASVIATYEATALLAISTQNAFSLTDGVNSTLLQGSQTQATVADGAAPILGSEFSSAPVYLDNNTNGAIETISTYWSENVAMTGTTADDWSISGGDFNTVFAATADDAGGDIVLNITVTADADKTGSAAAVTIAYDNDDANNSIVDASLNPAGTTGPLTATDGAAPMPVSAAYKDATGDGMVDRIDVTMTADTGLYCTFDAGDWSIPTPGTLIGANTPSDCVISGNDIQVTIAATADITGSGSNPTINYSNVAPKGSVGDTGNQTATFAAPVTATDGAAPFPVSAVYQDNSNDGSVDMIVITMSTDSGTACTFEAADWSVPTAGDIGVNTPSDCVAIALQNKIYLTVAADNYETGGAVDPAIRYRNLVTAGSIQDVLGNETGDFGVAGFTATDGAIPTISTITYKDADSDGKIDQVTLTYTETVVAGSVVSADDLIFDDVSDFTGMVFGNNASDLVTGAVTSTDVDLGTEATVFDTHDDGGTLAISTQNAFSLVDGSANITLLQGGQTQVTFADGAAPVIVTTSPASAATGVALDASLVFTFSEAMTQASVTGAIARTPSFTLGLASWTVGDTVLTYAAHDAFAGMQDYTITLAGTIASAAAGDGNLGSGPVANPFTFTTVASGGGGGGGGGLPASVMVMSPNGGESWAGLSSHNITWSSTSSTITKVKLFYSLDRGINFPYTIATDETNDGVYSWTVANVPSGTVKVKVEGYDSSGTFVASDISDADFTITYTTPPPATPETPGSGVSTEENPAGLVAGDLFKSPLSTTVYYYGSDNKRHIFPNEKTYKSWYTDWFGVKTITALELQQMALGKNVTVRPGTVLVKIDTNPKVYAVEQNGLLRWIPTEERIKILYGDDWAKKIIDVPLAFWGDYSFGSDISTDTYPTGALVQYSGTTDIYYVQGAEKRKITTVGFTANNLRSEYIFAIPATISYANGADITGAEEMLTKIY